MGVADALIFSKMTKYFYFKVLYNNKFMWMNLHVGTGSHLDSIVAKLDAWFGGLLTFLPAYIKKSSFSAAPGSRASFRGRWWTTCTNSTCTSIWAQNIDIRCMVANMSNYSDTRKKLCCCWRVLKEKKLVIFSRNFQELKLHFSFGGRARVSSPSTPWCN